MDFLHNIVIIIIVASCTFLTRLFPFALFGRNQQPPAIIKYLGNILPSAVIAILVIYCLKTVSFSKLPAFAPQLMAIAVVSVIHLWKRNFLLSISTGTICYMLMVQVLFGA